MPAGSRVRRHTPAPVSNALARLGERIRQARSEAGLSQAQLGQPHFTRAYVSALELGKIRPAVKSLEFLAAKLGKPSSYFFEDAEEERKRRERELEISAAAALVTRATAAEALVRIGSLLTDAAGPRESFRLRVMAARAHNLLVQGADALRELAAAERLAAQVGDAELARAARHQRAIALRTLGEPAQAQAILAEILSEIERSPRGDWLLKMKLLKDLGAVCWDLGEHQKAAAYYEAALALARDLGDVAGLIGIYNGLAYACRSSGDLEGAAGYLQRALAATQATNDLSAAALIYNALAVIAAELGHLETAMRHVDRAIELARTAGPESYVAHYLATKAECALKCGRSDLAKAAAMASLEIAERTGNARAAAAAKVALAQIAHLGGAPADAIHLLEEASEAYRDLDAKQELGEVLMQLSAIAKENGDLDLAQRSAEQAFHATKTASGLVRR